jgi:hypothetical protein
VEALGSDIFDKMNLIQSSQQQIKNQIELIKVSYHKFAEDLCQLLCVQQENSKNNNDDEPMEDMDGVAGQNGKFSGLLLLKLSCF